MIVYQILFFLTQMAMRFWLIGLAVMTVLLMMVLMMALTMALMMEDQQVIISYQLVMQMSLLANQQILASH